MPYTELLVKLDLRGNPPPFLCPTTEWRISTSTACHELTNDLFVLCWRWLSKMRVPHQVKALIIYLPCPTPNRYINIFTSCNSSPQYNSLFVPGIQIMLKDNKNRGTVQCQKIYLFPLILFHWIQVKLPLEFVRFYLTQSLLFVPQLSFFCFHLTLFLVFAVQLKFVRFHFTKSFICASACVLSFSIETNSIDCSSV